MSTATKQQFDDQVKIVIPSVFNAITSAADNEESEEAYNASKFGLPENVGKAGGACTSAFLKMQYENNDKPVSLVDALKKMQGVLKAQGFHQTPTLTSSRKIKKTSLLQIVPPNSGRRRAVLIGINYVGMKGALKACHNDCLNLQKYLVDKCKFNRQEMMVLMDDGKHASPTKENIENALIMLTKYSQPGDVNFISFSGHGGRTKDLDGDEEDGWDSTLIPVDFETEGQVVDDDILKMLVKPMNAGVTTTVLIDCCRSGTVMDLPYTLGANDKKMRREMGFNMEIVTDAVRPLTKSQVQTQRKEASKKKKEEKAARRVEKERVAKAKAEEEAINRRSEAQKNLKHSAGPGVMVFDKMPTAQEIEKLKQQMLEKLQMEAKQNPGKKMSLTSSTSVVYLPP